MTRFSQELSFAQLAAEKALLGTAATIPVATGPYNGPGALALNGTGYATTPHQDAFLSSALVSLDVRVKLATDTLTVNGGFARLVSCWGGDFSGWMLIANVDGGLGVLFANTSGGYVINSTGAGSIAVSTGTPIWVRMTYVFSGAGSGIMTLYSSTDGTNYSTVGSPQTVTGGQLKLGTAPLQIGPAAGSPVSNAMAIKAVQVLCNGATVVDADFSRLTAGATTVTASTGQIFTLTAPAAITGSASSGTTTPTPTPVPTPTPTPTATPTSNVSITYTGPMVAASVAATPALFGSYSGVDPKYPADHVAWLGKQPDLISVHGGQASENDFRNSIAFDIGDIQYNGAICVSVPLSWRGPEPATFASMAAILKQCGQGVYNADYTFAAQEVLRMLGTQDIIYVRTGWENNAYQLMPWSSGGQEADFIAAFQNFYTCFMAVSPKFRIIYCPLAGGADMNLTFPGKNFCHGVGLDVYVFPIYGAPSDPYLCWDYMLHRPCGLLDLKALADANGLFMCFPEFGTCLDYAGPYLELHYQWCIDNNVRYTNYWDSNGDYPSALSEGSQLLATAAAYRHLHNPSKYPSKPIVQINMLQRQQDFADKSAWSDGYIGNGTVTRPAPGTIAFDGAGSGSGNQQVVWQQSPLPVGNYLFADTITRTAGSDTVSIWAVGDTGNIATFDMDTTRLPLNQPTRIVFPVVVTNRVNQFSIRFFHGGAGQATIYTNPGWQALGLWEDTTTDPTPQAGLVAVTPPPSLVTFAGAAGAPTGNQVLSGFFPPGTAPTTAQAGLDGAGAVVFDGSNTVGVLQALGVQHDGLYTFNTKIGATAPSRIVLMLRATASNASLAGYYLAFHLNDGSPPGSVELSTYANASFVSNTILTGNGGAQVPQHSVGVRLKGNVLIAYVDGVAVGSCGDTTITADGFIGIGGSNIGFTGVTYTA